MMNVLTTGMYLVFILTMLTPSLSLASPVAADGTGAGGDNVIGCRDSPADIYFLLDCSSSVWVVDYEKMLEFVVSLVKHFEIHPNATRVGLGVFADDFRHIIDFRDHSSKDTLIEAIRVAPYLSGNTYTGKGIYGMRTWGFRAEVVRPNVTKIGVVVTDGRSSSRSSTIAEATQARDQQIWLFAIGVGTNVDMQELSIIASEPRDEFAFHVATFDILVTLADRLAISTCKLNQPQSDGSVCGTKRKADIIFVYNAAGMSSREVNVVQNFTRFVIGESDMASGNVRAGIISSDCQGEDINLSKYLRKDDFIKALSEQPRPKLGPLMKRARLYGYDTARGSRLGALKMTIVFIDDPMFSREELLYEALLLKYDDVLIHVVTIGSNYVMSEVKGLATSPDHITAFETYDQLQNDSVRRKQFLDKFCEHI